MRCTSCGGEIPPGQKVCPTCGSPVHLDLDDQSQLPPIRGLLTVVQVAGDVPEGGTWVGDLDLEGQDIFIGRLPSSDITLQGDSLVSRRHARLFRKRNDYYVEDLGSSNGTYLNGVFLSAPNRLVGGETIRVGLFEIRYRRDNPETDSEDTATLTRESTNSLQISALRRMSNGDAGTSGWDLPTKESGESQDSPSTSFLSTGSPLTLSGADWQGNEHSGALSEIELLREQVRSLGQLIRERTDEKELLINSLHGTNTHLYRETLTHINEVLSGLLDTYENVSRVSEQKAPELIALAREAAHDPGNLALVIRFAGRSKDIATVLYNLQISGIRWETLRTLRELQRHVANMLQTQDAQPLARSSGTQGDSIPRRSE